MPPECALPLYHGQTNAAWHLKTSADLAALAAAGSVPILPVCSFCRRSENGGLDLEEQRLGEFLAVAPEETFLILPPLRYCPKQDPRQQFTVPSTVAWELLSDILQGVHASGFKKCIIFHGHPLLADWLDCGLRDHRLETGMGLFRMSLESVGVDIEHESQDPRTSKISSDLKAASETFLDLLDHIKHQPYPPP